MKHALQVMQSVTRVFSAQVVTNIFSMAYVIFLARVLTKTDLAAFAVFGILTHISRVSVNLGLETTCIQRLPSLIAEGQDEVVSSMFKTTIVSRILLSLIFSAMIFLLAPGISYLFFKTSDYVNIVKIMSFGVFFFSLNDSMELLAQVTQQFGKISINQIIISFSSRIISVVMYFFLGIKGALAGFCWIPFIGVILYFLLLRKWLSIRAGFYPWFKLVRYSFPFYGREFIRFSLMQLDQFMVGILLGPAVLSTYFIARKITDYIFMVTNAVGNPIRIKIAELKSEGLAKMAEMFRTVSRYYFFLFIPLSFCIASISYPLLQILGGSKYTNGTGVLILLTLGMLMYSLFGIFSMNIVILGKPKEILKLDTLGGLTNTIFIVIFAYFFNASGVAFAKFLAFTVSLFYGKHILERIIEVQIDKKALADSLTASVCMFFVIVFLQIIHYRLILIPLYVLAGFAVFILIFSRRVDREDVNLLENFLPKQTIISLFFRIFR